MRTSVLVLAFVACFALIEAKNYAVLVTSIRGLEYLAYSVQADTCHAYHLLINSGMAHEDIILMSYGDAAEDPSNNFPGELYNSATDATQTPVEVNKGCAEHIDYLGAEVSPANFLAVLTGDSAAVPAGKPVLQSTAEDNVFIMFENHGGPGAIYFFVPSDFTPLYAADLMTALKTMETKKMYSQLVFYLMACNSGSMFDKILPANMSIYATTATTPTVEASAIFCSPKDLIKGQSSTKESNCLASEFGFAWTNETDGCGIKQSLETQFTSVKKSMSASTPAQYGDLTFDKEPLSDIFSEPSARRHARAAQDCPPLFNAGLHIAPAPSADSGRVRMGPGSFRLFTLQQRIRRAEESFAAAEMTAAHMALASEMSLRSRIDAHFESWAASALRAADLLTSENEVQPLLQQLRMFPDEPILHTACMRGVDAAIASACGGYTDYSRVHASLVINTCRMVAVQPDVEAKLPALMKSMCLLWRQE